MIGRALVADEEALVEVGPRGLVHRGGALHALIHRQVADVAVVELQRQLLLERQRVELARGLERRLHDPRRHAVAREVEEADALARVADLRGDRVQSGGLAAKRGAEVDHGDRARDFRDVLHRHRLEDVHGAATIPFIGSHYPTRGSSRSRSASPTRFSASTMTKIARPGSSTTCGLRITNCRPVASMLPQSAVGGCVPRPRNDRPAVARILAPTSRLNATMTGDSKCGSTCRPRMTASLAPSARAASTNSRSRSESTTPRTRRV